MAVSQKYLERVQGKPVQVKTVRAIIPKSIIEGTTGPARPPVKKQPKGTETYEPEGEGTSGRRIQPTIKSIIEQGAPEPEPLLDERIGAIKETSPIQQFATGFVAVPVGTFVSPLTGEKPLPTPTSAIIGIVPSGKRSPAWETGRAEAIRMGQQTRRELSELGPAYFAGGLTAEILQAYALGKITEKGVSLAGKGLSRLGKHLPKGLQNIFATEKTQKATLKVTYPKETWKTHGGGWRKEWQYTTKHPTEAELSKRGAFWASQRLVHVEGGGTWSSQPIYAKSGSQFLIQEQVSRGATQIVKEVTKQIPEVTIRHAQVPITTQKVIQELFAKTTTQILTATKIAQPSFQSLGYFLGTSASTLPRAWLHRRHPYARLRETELQQEYIPEGTEVKRLFGSKEMEKYLTVPKHPPLSEVYARPQVVPAEYRIGFSGQRQIVFDMPYVPTPIKLREDQPPVTILKLDQPPLLISMLDQPPVTIRKADQPPRTIPKFDQPPILKQPPVTIRKADQLPRFPIPKLPSPFLGTWQREKRFTGYWFPREYPIKSPEQVWSEFFGKKAPRKKRIKKR